MSGCPPLCPRARAFTQLYSQTPLILTVLIGWFSPSFEYILDVHGVSGLLSPPHLSSLGSLLARNHGATGQPGKWRTRQCQKTQVKKETISGPLTPVQVFIPPTRRTTQPPQDRTRSLLDKATVSPAAFPLAPRTRPQYPRKWTGGASSVPANPDSSKELAAPSPSPGAAPTTPSPHVSVPTTENSNLDRGLVTAAQQLRVDVVNHPKVDPATITEPSPKPAVDDVMTKKERRVTRDERRGSWDWQYESEMALQRYSVVINEGDSETSAEEEGNPEEPPESLLQLWQQSTTHEDRHRSWDPTWEPVMDLFRYSMTSEDLQRLEVERRTKPWLQSQPPESPKPKRIFNWFGLGGNKKTEERGRAQARRRRLQ
ncbi:hypothetical protein M407DRAFT_222222 [Tulasnella calospora MUT 4182]|uniref:Uncharacterized protein n=1 Tax=Tulasnella calospora MUT 4182 TaxID=1051891 RepID=A0A0C3Q749_9AGAM|nr:hypothetical protein M407DRAFT_222222 [Tulasnella calospora MUT 4182]